MVSTATAPHMVVDEMTSGELLTEDQFRKEMRRKDRKQARRVAEKSEPTRSQLEQDQKPRRGGDAIAYAWRGESASNWAMCVDGSTHT